MKRQKRRVKYKKLILTGSMVLITIWLAGQIKMTMNTDPTTAEPGITNQEYSGNPIVDHIYTADPSALVHDDSLFLYTGHDEQTKDGDFFLMNDWHVFSTTDMVNWHDHGAPLSHNDFDWAVGNAFAGHCIEHDGKFWWYVPMVHESIKVDEGFAIGVAVADNPAGPFKDALGEPIITDETPNSIPLNIDPFVWIEDGEIYLYWGSWGECRYVKLKDNMVEMDGPVQTVNAPHFFEAPYIHKRNDTYYLTYAKDYPSQTVYSTSNSPTGPWEYQGVINDYVENSETNHQAVVKYKGTWYFVYHNGSLPEGGTYRRSVCVDLLHYNSDGSIKQIEQTKKGVPKISPTHSDVIHYDPNHDDMKIFPNPAKQNEFHLAFSKPDEGLPIDIAITDISGKKMFHTTKSWEHELRLDVELPKGTYIVTAQAESHNYSTRFNVMP